MIPAVHYHLNRTEISFVKNGTPKVVSLLPYLAKSDSVGVVVECWNSGASTKAIVFDTNADYTTGCNIIAGSLLHFILRLNGVDKEITVSATDSDCHVAIVAELRGPGVVMHDTPIHYGKFDVGPGDINKWLNQSVTLEGADQPENVDSVLVMATTNQTYSGYDWGVRGLGSTWNRIWKQAEFNCLYYLPSATDDGDYQVWVPGKTSPTFAVYMWFWEVGYVRKGYGFSGILNPQDEGPSQQANWTTRAAGGGVPQNAVGMFAVSNPIGAGTRDHGLRALGSTNGSGVAYGYPFDAPTPVLLDASRQYQYLADSASPEIWPVAYTTVREASWSGPIKFVAQGDGKSLVFASGQAAIEFLASGEATVIVPAELAATPAIVSVLGGTPRVASVLGGEPAVDSALGGKPRIPD